MRQNRKGEISTSFFSVIFVLIGLVIFFFWILNVGAKEAETGTYMSLAPGVKMKVLPTEVEGFKMPPGGFMFVDGISCKKTMTQDIKSKIRLASPDYCEKIERIPLLVMQPLISGGGKCLEKDASYGNLKLQMDFDLDRLKNYISEKHKLSFGEGKEKESISIKICWGNGKCYGEENSGLTFEELITSGECSETSEGKISCMFKLENLAEKCCPNYTRIETGIRANLGSGEDGSDQIAPMSFDPTPVAPLIIYYTDASTGGSLSEQDSLFENFAEFQSRCFFDEEKKDTPVKDIFIYPCRAVVPEAKFESLDIAGVYAEKVSFKPCESATDYVKLESGWLCKKGSKGYYLLNPYAYCKLEGDSFPENPEPIYLENMIPSEPEKIYGLINHQAEMAWIIAKKEINEAYKLT